MSKEGQPPEIPEPNPAFDALKNRAYEVLPPTILNHVWLHEDGANPGAGVVAGDVISSRGQHLTIPLGIIGLDGRAYTFFSEQPLPEVSPETQRRPDQSYYWTPEWQADEKEADEDIKAGRVRTYQSAEEAIRDIAPNIADEVINSSETSQ